MIDIPRSKELFTELDDKKNGIKVYIAYSMTYQDNALYNKYNKIQEIICFMRELGCKVCDPAVGDKPDMSVKLMVKKDYDAINECDILVAYLPKDIITHGTIFEIARAQLLNKVIFIITDYVNSPFLKEASSFDLITDSDLTKIQWFKKLFEEFLKRSLYIVSGGNLWAHRYFGEENEQPFRIKFKDFLESITSTESKFYYVYE